MEKILKRLFKFVAYTAAGAVILLAVAVGLFRLFLPRLPEYQEQIKVWASEAIGMDVEFSAMDARWGLSGPELEFYDAELRQKDSQLRVVAAERVSVGVALIRLLRDRRLVVDQVVVRDTSIEVRQLEQGGLWIQGNPAEQLLQMSSSGAGALGKIEVVGEDIELLFMRPGDQRPAVFELPQISLRNDEQRLAVDALLRLPENLGRQIVVTATQLPPSLSSSSEDREWLATFDVGGLDLAGVSAFVGDPRFDLGAGRGDVELSLAVAAGTVRSATATLDLVDVELADAAFGRIAGRIDFRKDQKGWLLAADELRVEADGNAWPRSAYRLETKSNADGKLVTLDLVADYLDLAVLDALLPLAPEAQRTPLARLAVDGVVRNLAATLSEFDTDTPRYSVAADFERAGVAAYGRFPGIRGFTGRLRADRAGGRLEIRSGDMTIDLADYVSEPIPVENAFGTVIWRQSRDKLTILSDNITIQNADIDSRSNVQITVGNGAAPVVDLASTWTVADLGSAKRFIPERIMHPALYSWFQMALVSGEVRNGSTRLYGPLDKFPFDGGEGRFLLEGEVRESTFRFLRRWPSVEIGTMDVVLDNTRLYTERNRSLTQGLDVLDAKVEIADLRDAVLTIDSGSTATLAAIQDYVRNSPINEVLGGQVDRVTVLGDGTFDLDLEIPLNRWREFSFTTRIATNNGELSINGFDPPVTELSGNVTIERDLVSSEALTGRFLGEPVTIELLNAPLSEPRFQIIARAMGTATGDALVRELGVPMDGLIAGRAAYRADVLFPRIGQASPAPLTIRIESDLAGFELALPVPLNKPADENAPVSAELRFPADNRIETSGSATSAAMDWRLAFVADDAGWDFERGMLALGGAPAYPPETRGLHIVGNIEDFRLEDWLALARQDGAQVNVADRIRSVEVQARSLRLLGQRYQDHRVRVDRSARDWLVQLDGESASGSVFVPYEFTADRPLVLDMERLVLPGGDDKDQNEGDRDDTGDPDPRRLPPVSLRAADFAIGNRHFGAVTAEFDQTGEGLVADNIIATDASFEIVGNGAWVADDSDPSGSRSSIVATLTSTDVEQTMRRLDYEPGIVGDDMTMLLNLAWGGGPRLDFLDTLDGEVQVRFGPGNLDEIEPGAGRMFGLMSVVALPRRLSLDFSDVFGKGFGFDQIEGTFRIVDGETYTCNLSLEGPAAHIGIIGRTSLVERDYEQAAIVSANFGDTLPVAGLLVGPQVAAALLVFSQIFKKPLQEMGQVYYSIDGSWDEPIVDSADASSFMQRSRLAGCIAETEQARQQ